MESTEMAIVPQQNLFVSPIVGMDEAKAKFDQVRQFTAKCLTKGVDYGTVAGIAKPSLLKPGAEKIGTLFGLTPRFILVDSVKNWNGEGNPDNEPFFYFEYKCELYRNGEYVASCDASCNSWEKKYRYRKSELVCPSCGKPLRRSKNKDEFYCWAKQGGCGATFATNDPRITEQKVGDVRNFDSAEQVNTFQKMAQKRAFVGAILIACNLSEYYTQDVEDMASFAITNDIPEIIDGDFTQAEPQKVQPTEPQRKPFDEAEYLKNWHKPANVQEMSKMNAEKIQDSKGQPYGEKTTYELMNMLKVITKKIESVPDNLKPDYQLKVSAICEILQNRKLALILPEERQNPFVGKQFEDVEIPFE